MPLVHLREEQVRRIIACATALNAAFPHEGVADLSSQQTLDGMFEYLSSAEVADLDESLRTLSDDQRHELTALMWLGRGDAGNDFQALVREARAKSDSGDIDYIAEKAPSLPL